MKKKLTKEEILAQIEARKEELINEAVRKEKLKREIEFEKDKFLFGK